MSATTKSPDQFGAFSFSCIFWRGRVEKSTPLCYSHFHVRYLSRSCDLTNMVERNDKHATARKGAVVLF